MTKLTTFSMLFFLLGFNLWSQTESLLKTYHAYIELPREVAYLHLNKTTLVKGEHLGFTAYVLDKASKQLSQATRNLYCVVTNKNDSIVKQQLLKVDSGVTSGTIALDSLFASGNYTVKAYTNYMRNFKERNHFIQQIRVIDPDKETEIIPVKTSKQLDVQLLPEGGHLVADIPNILGVVVKGGTGFGIGNLTGKLKDQQHNTITTFKLNHLGISRFLITPKVNQDYYIEFNIEGNKTIPINGIEDKGINVQLTDMGDKVALNFQTNKETHKIIKNKVYTLAIHSGHDIEMLPITFTNEKEMKVFSKADLFTGINIFTLFNENNQPILERLYFNYKDLNINSSEVNKDVVYDEDTTTVTIRYKNLSPSKFNNFSVSVLPAKTRSYEVHHNIISQNYLQPYVKSYIEDAQYYFTNITKEKQYDLDNLLLTQGWSSYSWDNVFNNPPKQEYNFDTGISFKIKPKKQKSQQLLLHSINGSQPEFLSFSKEEKGYIITDKYPIKGDVIKISKVQNAGHLINTNSTVEYYPNIISKLKDSFMFLGSKELNKNKQVKMHIVNFDKNSLANTQKLDEVIVIAKKKEEERRFKIKAKSQGRVDFFNEGRNNFPSFVSYIQTKGFRYDEVLNNVYHIVRDTIWFPSFYINGDRVSYNSPLLKDLFNLPLNRFDYVVTSRYKTDYPDPMGNSKFAIGFIKIHMRDPGSITIKDIRKRFTKFIPPLAFEPKKKFYSPKYQSYQDTFFKEYGVIHWLPKNSLNNQGDLQISFPSLDQKEVKLFIEGVTEEGTFVSETKLLILTKNE